MHSSRLTIQLQKHTDENIHYLSRSVFTSHLLLCYTALISGHVDATNALTWHIRPYLLDNSGSRLLSLR